MSGREPTVTVPACRVTVHIEWAGADETLAPLTTTLLAATDDPSFPTVLAEAVRRDFEDWRKRVKA